MPGGLAQRAGHSAKHLPTLKGSLMKSGRFKLKYSAAAALPAIAHRGPGAAVEGYVPSRYAHQPVRSGFGECVRDYGWKAGMSFADCEPAPVQPVAAAAPQAAPEQELPLAEAPPPAPQIAAVAVPYLLSVDELFDFDSASLKPGGRPTPHALAARMRSAGLYSAAIFVHADPPGP